MLPPKGYEESKRRWEELTSTQKKQATYWFRRQQEQDLAKHGRPRVGGGFYSQSYRFKDKPLPQRYPKMDQHAPEWGRVPDQPERQGMPDIWGVGRHAQDPEERYHRPPGWRPKPPIGKPRPLPPRQRGPRKIRVSVHSPEGYVYTAIMPSRGGNKWIYNINTGKRISVSAETFNQLQRQGGEGFFGYKGEGKRAVPTVMPISPNPEEKARPWYWDRRIETEPPGEPKPRSILEVDYEDRPKIKPRPKPVVGPKKPGEPKPEKYRMIRKPNAPPPGPREQAFLSTYLNMLENPRGPRPQVIIPKEVIEYVRLNYMRLPEKTYRKKPIRPRAKPMPRAKQPHKKPKKPKQMPKSTKPKKQMPKPKKPKQMPKPKKLTEIACFKKKKLKKK